MFAAALTNAMEAGAGTTPQQAVGPVELGPSSYAPDDPDSPDRGRLTIRGMSRFLNMSEDWAIKNRFRVKGHFRVNRAHRYDRETLVKAMLSGQVIEEKTKPASLGLKRRRR